MVIVLFEEISAPFCDLRHAPQRRAKKMDEARFGRFAPMGCRGRANGGPGKLDHSVQRRISSS
jgi:hypothetical protein